MKQQLKDFFISWLKKKVFKVISKVASGLYYLYPLEIRGHKCWKMQLKIKISDSCCKLLVLGCFFFSLILAFCLQVSFQSPGVSLALKVKPGPGHWQLPSGSSGIISCSGLPLCSCRVPWAGILLWLEPFPLGHQSREKATKFLSHCPHFCPTCFTFGFLLLFRRRKRKRYILTGETSIKRNPLHSRF